ncbi:MAG TPA: glycoside hydrolase family 30 beta sandwich domain-containing protein [Chitinophagaceae bacterium]|jgi:glucosylceramidase|nr:glycoside hydrolase family 30 beta sandwich domain-containing protein [Chitinophagaceae bacterium]
MQKTFLISFLLIGLLSVQSNCSKNKNPDNNTSNNNNDNNNSTGPSISSWITKGDQSALLQKQSDQTFGAKNNSYDFIDVDTTQTFQSIDGFGYTLTGGSAYLINKLSASEKSSLLNELFGSAESSISISYLRISIGASDLNSSVFSYDDMPAGQTDVNLNQFSLSQDTVDLIPVLKQILVINPNIKILGSPWSPPVWMKDNGSSVGGSLQPQYYDAYARYFVKYIQQMQARGITIDAITPQNEPLHGGNNPSMVMTAQQQTSFIKNNLGPVFQAAGINTKIIVYDHNCDKPDYPITVLNDPAAKQFVDGSAFHLYAGDISALSTVHNVHPDKNLYFTEQWTGANGSFDGDLRWHVKNVIVGSMRNWSRVALEWNLANDAGYNPHTPGGCTECKGALTIDGSVRRNVSYYIIAHVSKFIPAGSVRIGSNIASNLYNAAFRTPAGKKVLIVVNDATSASIFNIRFNGQWVTTNLAGGAVGTYIW